ncbi:MAG: protease, CAAX amino terminal family [Acidobacteria bacterium OLB17]|nr:MAG: protease, CAAX amino terminal family [Acidobacteria bacterium OLB17]MCZ2391907.1 CPBP family intramembrane metalloprotease [Acidobacteriota bacterium]
MTVSAVFFDANGTIRSGWRALFFLVLFGFVSVAAQAFVLAATHRFQSETADQRLVGLVGLAANLFIAVGAAWGCGWLFEKLPFAAFGASFSKGWLRHLAIGNLLGLLAIAFAILPAFVSGNLSFAVTVGSSSEIAYQIGISLLFFALGAAFEEALFRGYILQTFARSGLAWLAILLTSAIFGLVHLANPAADQISTVNTVLAGIVFSLAYLKTLDLWLPFGLHFMWNFAQGSIFGIEVSGLKFLSPVSLLVESDHGPKWLTGEAYGIEGSVGCTIALLLLIAAIYLFPGLARDERVAELSRPRHVTPTGS